MPIIEADCGQIDLVNWGEGDRHLVMLHASSTGPYSFNKLATRFADAGWQISAPGFVGYGGTKLKDAFFDGRVKANTAIARAAAAGAPNMVLGHSMGGLYGLLYALDAQDAGRPLDALILYEPILMGLLDPDDPAQRAARDWDREIVERLLHHVEQGDHEAGVQAFIEGWNETTWLDLPEAARTHLIGMADNLVAECRAVTWLEIDPDRLSRLTTPVLLLRGDSSPVPIELINQRAATILPNATSVVLPGCGHMAPLLNPQPVATTVMDWLQQQGG